MRRSRHGRDLMRSFSIAGLCLFALVTMPALAGQNAAAPNTLTAAERAEGWQLLFDGHDLSGWRSFGGGAPSPHWVVRAGALVLNTTTGAMSGGDTVPADQIGKAACRGSRVPTE